MGLLSILLIFLNIPIAGALLYLAWQRASRHMLSDPGLGIDNALGKTPGLFLIAGSALGLIAALVMFSAHRELSLMMPEALDMLLLPVLYLTLAGSISYLFSYALAIALKTRHRERNSLAAASVMVVAAVIIAQAACTWPRHSRLRNDITHDGIVMQSSSYSCTAASGANIARRLGIETTEREMAWLMGTSMLGTTHGQAAFGLRRLDIRCSKTRTNDITSIRPPALLAVDHPDAGPEGHSVMLAGVRNGIIEIWDPLIGRRKYDTAEVGAIWHGAALECTKEAEQP